MPFETAEMMLPELARLAEEMIDAIQRGVPEYARPLDDAYRATRRHAVTHALEQFVERIANPATPREKTATVFREIAPDPRAQPGLAPRTATTLIGGLDPLLATVRQLRAAALSISYSRLGVR